MGAYLRPLPRCATCNAGATQVLVNAANAPLYVYCEKHAVPALKKLVAENPDQAHAWR